MENKEVFASSNANWWEGGQKVKAGETFQPRKLNTPLDKLTRKQAAAVRSPKPNVNMGDTSKPALLAIT